MILIDFNNIFNIYNFYMFFNYVITIKKIINKFNIKIIYNKFLYFFDF